MTNVTLKVEGMTCQHCVRTVQETLERQAGVERARVDLTAGRAVIDFDETKNSPGALAHAVTDEGYTAEELP